MTDRIGPRCPAVMLTDARPLLPAVASARMAGRPEPSADWQCVREPHSDAPVETHLAMPFGPTGTSVRFSAQVVQPVITATVGDPLPDDAPRRADPEQVRRLIELVDRPGTTAVHVEDGDELLLLMPEATDDKTIEQATTALAELFPTVSFLVLAGVTGAVVMPKRTAKTYDELIAQRDALIMQGVDPDQLTMPVRRLDPNA